MKQLSKQQIDIVIRTQNAETLESVAKRYKLSRERVRQIKKESIDFLLKHTCNKKEENKIVLKKERFKYPIWQHHGYLYINVKTKKEADQKAKKWISDHKQINRLNDYNAPELTLDFNKFKLKNY